MPKDEKYSVYNYPPPPMVYGQPVFVGAIPLKQEENLVVAGLGGAALAGTGVVAWEVATEGIWNTISKKDGPLTKTAKKYLLGTGIKEEAYRLFERRDERNTLKQLGNFTENSWGVAKKAGGALGKFGKALSKTSTGKWMAATVGAAALVGGITSADDAYKRNHTIPKPRYGEFPPLAMHASLKHPAF